MLRQQSLEVAQEEESVLNYQGKKLLHTVRIQILDIENTLHYIQKKHSVHQIKEAFSQIYNALNEMEPLFRILRANFVHQQVKKIVNCFGIIYVILLDNIEKNRKNPNSKEAQSDSRLPSSKTQLPNQLHDQNTLSQSKENTLSRPLGGVHLYNQHYKRNLQLGPSWKKQSNNKCSGELSKQQFREMVLGQLQQPINVSSPDQILDIFSFKFRHGKDKEVVTFHDELLSISNFFKQAQNQAFQFLSKTKDQASIIKYNDSFTDILSKVAEEKDKKIQIFSDKIKQVFSSIRGKTQQTVAQIQKKLIKESGSKSMVQSNDIQTQTIYNIEQQLKSYKKRLSDSQQRYKLIMQFKKKEINQAAKVQLQLQNQLNLKNRQIVYLKLSLQQDKLVISNLNRKMKQIGEINKFKDVRSNQQANNNTLIVENNVEIDKNEVDSAEDEAALEFLRKQKRAAKKVLLEKRKSILIEDKSAFSKRYTQQLDPQRPLNSFAFGKNLSEISQGEDSQSNESQHQSMFTNSNNPPQIRRPKKLNSNLLHTKNSGNLHHPSRKQLKTKKSAGSIGGLQFVPSIIGSSGSKNSIYDDDLSSDRNSSVSIDDSDYQKIQMMFQKQAKKTNQILAKKRNSGVSNSQPKPKSFFSQGKQNEIKNKIIPQQKASISSNRSQQSNQKSQINQQHSQSETKQFKNLESNLIEQTMSVPEILQQILSKKRSNLAISSAEFQQCLNSAKKTMQYSMQTSFKRIADQNQTQGQMSRPSHSKIDNYKPIYSAQQKHLYEFQTKNKLKRVSTEKKQKEEPQLFTRSATQSKFFSKGRQLKAFFSSALKNHEKFLTKNTEKSIEEDALQNSHSCFEMHQDLHKEIQRSFIPTKAAPISSLMEQKEEEIEREARKLAVKCKNLQEFKIKFSELHRPLCGGSCKHLQKFVQNYVKYRQQSKPRIRMAVKNVSESIHSGPEQDPSRLPSLDTKNGHH